MNLHSSKFDDFFIVLYFELNFQILEFYWEQLHFTISLSIFFILEAIDKMFNWQILIKFSVILDMCVTYLLSFGFFIYIGFNPCCTICVYETLILTNLFIYVLCKCTIPLLSSYNYTVPSLWGLQRRTHFYRSSGFSCLNSSNVFIFLVL